MVSKTLRELTGQTSDPNAWETLFRHFNQTTGRGDVSYKRGDTIVIKINMNQDNGSTWTRGQGHPSPHVIYSVVNQLINVAGVPITKVTGDNSPAKPKSSIVLSWSNSINCFEFP